MIMTKKKYLHLGIAVLLFVLLELFMPLIYGLTAEGRSFFAILVSMVYLWLTVDTFVSSLLALAMLGIMQVLPSGTILASSIGSGALAIVLFANLLICAVGASGALKRVTQWFLSRKIIAGHMYRFFFFLGLSCFILGALISATYTILVVIPMVNEVCESLNCKNSSRFKTAAMLFAMWSCIAGGISFPYGKITYITLMTTLSSFDVSVSFNKLFLIVFPVGVLWMLFGLLVVKYILKPEEEVFTGYSPELILNDIREFPLSKQAKLLSGGLVFMVILWVISSFGDSWSFAAYLNKVGYHFIAAGIFAVLCFVQIDGQPVINIKQIFAKNSWSVFIFGAMIVFCSSSIGNSAFGIKDFLIGILGPIFGNVSPVLVFIIAALVAAVMTNFTSNLVTLVVVCTVFIPILQISTGNITMSIVLSVAVSMIVGMACVTPAACPCAAFVLDGENTNMKDGLAANIAMMTFGAVLALAAAMFF